MRRMRRRLLAGIMATGVVVIAGGILASMAVASPASGIQASVLSRGSLQGDVSFNTDHVQGGQLTWFGKQWSPDRLPEFLGALRQYGTTNVGEWLALHPAAAAKLGLAPVGMLKSPEVVKQRMVFPAGAHTGWSSLSGGYLLGTVVSGEVVRYKSDCTPQKLAAGQSFYQTGAGAFTVRNESGGEAVLTATYVAPSGTPDAKLHVDKPQPTGCV
jgi:hypothetical protein